MDGATRKRELDQAMAMFKKRHGCSISEWWKKWRTQNDCNQVKVITDNGLFLDIVWG